MKVNELPKDKDITNLRVIIPDDVFKSVGLSDLRSKKVYLKSTFGGGAWVATDLGSIRVYPIQCIPKDILDWEIWEENASG